MTLDVDCSVIPDRAAVRVLLVDFQHLNINRQPSDPRDRLAHVNPHFLFEFIEKYIARNGILENPYGKDDVGFGIAFVNGIRWILLNFGRDRLP